jgi:hypothetical protein
VIKVAKKVKRTSLLRALRKVKLDVEVPKETQRINPLESLLPGAKTEETQVGVAKVGGEKTVYIKTKLKVGG